MLTRVTITGADDKVDPQALVALSQEYPYVEWGILYSEKRVGRSRYPSDAWRARLGEVSAGMHLSLHLCGANARAALAGHRGEVNALPAAQRVQLNGYSPWGGNLVRHPRVEWILQVRSEAGLQEAADEAKCGSLLGGASLLFDPSGGRGIEAFRWPSSPMGVAMGYAGGIKPSNVEQVLKDIGPLQEDFWIDMESGVRRLDDKSEEDDLDLDLVREVLEKAQPWVQK